jgi:hypothetical protein
MGLMILRDGSSPEPATMAFLDYGPLLPHAHKQQDYGNIGLWAYGVEMISEMGYTTYPVWNRKWQVKPVAHNTVLEVGAQEQKGEPMIWYAEPGCQMAEAGLPGKNSRFIGMFSPDGNEPVLVDVFRVNGDTETSTWTMHARSSDWKVAGVDDLEPVEVEAPLRNGRRGSAPGNIDMEWPFNTDNSATLRTTVLSDTAATVTLAECPPEEDEINKAHVSGGNPKPGVEMPYRGHVQVTRPNPAVFAAVHVPGCDARADSPVAELISIDGRPDVVAVDVRDIGGARIIVIHAPQPGPVTCRGLTVDGRAGAVCLRGDTVQWLCIAGGASARYGEMSVMASERGNGFAR